MTEHHSYQTKKNWWIHIGWLSLLVIAVLLFALLSVRRGAGLRFARNDKELVVYCAAGMRLPVQEAAKSYTEKYDQPIRLEYASSGDLEIRIRREAKFGKPLAAFQALQFKLADMATELVAARQLVRLAAFKLDSQDPEASAYCAMAKRFATDIGYQVCDSALQLHGGYGYIREYPLERYVRDVRVHQILEGTNEIMRLIIARRLLDETAGELL